MPRETDQKDLSTKAWTVLGLISPENRNPKISRESTQVIEHLSKESAFEDEDEDEDKKVHVEEKHWLVDSWPFLGIVYLVIMINSVQVGLAVDHPELQDLWDYCDWLSTLFFTVEMLIKLLFLRCKYFSNGWNRMDFILVIMSIFDTFVFQYIQKQLEMDGKTSGGMGDSSALRIVRILRVARLVRLLKVFKQLWMIVQGIWNSISALFWVICLLTLVVYMSSIFCVSVIGESTKYPGRTEDEQEFSEWQEWNNYQYFGTIRRSMYTLFNIVMMSEVDVIGRPLYERQPHMLLFFVLFAVFTSLGVLNVIIGIIVENTMECAKKMEEEDKQAVKSERISLLGKILNVVMQLDTDKNEEVTLRELEAGWTSSKFKELFEGINLPSGWTPQDFMHLLDQNGDGSLAAGEFMKVFYQLLTDDQFQQMCILHASVNQVKGMILQLTKQLSPNTGRNSPSESFAQPTIKEVLNDLSASAEISQTQLAQVADVPQTNYAEETGSDSVVEMLKEIKQDLNTLRLEQAASQQKQDALQRQQEAFREEIMTHLTSKEFCRSPPKPGFELPGATSEDVDAFDELLKKHRRLNTVGA